MPVHNIRLYLIFDRIRLKDEDFTANNYDPGTAGETSLYSDFLTQSNLK